MDMPFDGTTPAGGLTATRAILQALPAHAALLDEEGCILEVNDAWVRFATENGLAAAEGKWMANYLAVCDRSADSGCDEAARVATGIRDVISGTADEFSLEYTCHTLTQRRWFCLTVRPAEVAGLRRALVMHVDVTDRKKGEDALRQQSAFLRHAQRIAELGYWFLDLPAGQLVLSEEARRILAMFEGESPDSRSVLLERFHPEDKPVVHGHLHRLECIDSTADFQARIRRSDGIVRWLRIRAESAMHDGGRRIAGTVVDITERRAAGEAVRESEVRARHSARLLARTLDMSLDVICIIGADGRFQQVSAACERLWGYTPQTLIGSEASALVVEEDLERTLQIRAQVRAGHPATSFKNRLRRADGSVAYVSWSERWADKDGVSYCVARDESSAHLLQEAHRQRELFLQAALDSVEDAFILYDRQLRFTYLNRTAEQLLRSSRDELVGRTLEQAFPEVRATELPQRLRAAIAEEKGGEFEYYYPPFDLWCGIRVFPSPDGLTVYFRDIGEERRMREALVASEERFKLVARVTADAVWDWDVVNDTIWWSESIHSLFGVESHETQPGTEGWGDRLHPEERSAVQEGLDAALASDADTWTAYYRFRRTDGTYAMVHDRAFVIRDARGRAVRMVGGMSDVTAQRRIEDQMREQAHLLDAARDAIHVLDASHRVRYWNRSAEKLYGWSADEVHGAPVHAILRAEASAFEKAAMLVLEKGAWAGELERTTRDGRRLVVDSRWTLMRDAHGEPARTLVIETDATEEKAREAQAMRSQRLDSIGELAGGIAHDLNNVFTPILMSANLLTAAQAPGSPEQTLVSAIASSAQRGADMVAHLLSFARGAEGRPTVIDPSRVLAEVHSIATDTFPKNIRVELEIAPGLWTIEADTTQLHQVLLNLAVNARDAMQDGGRLTLRAENLRLNAATAAAIPDAREGDYIVIEVTDTGTGIAPKVMERLFDPFFTTKERGKGTGLGLPTSRAIVKGHRGFIQVRTVPGRGSTFQVGLPALPASRPPSPDDESPPAPLGRGECILVVDDEPEIRRIVAAALESRGYRTLSAVDGADAIATFVRKREAIDAVIMDMMMPVMDGAAAIQVLKRMDSGLRIVASTGYATGTQVAKAREAGVELVLAKPFTTKTLLETLARALAGRPPRAAPD